MPGDSGGLDDRGADTAPPDGAFPASEAAGAVRGERKAVLLRLDPAVHEAMARWAADELRSVNAQIELALRDALARAGRGVRPAAPRRRGRPPASGSAPAGDAPR